MSLGCHVNRAGVGAGVFAQKSVSLVEMKLTMMVLEEMTAKPPDREVQRMRDSSSCKLPQRAVFLLT